MKTNYMVISFGENGEVDAMHRDQFQLGFLGPQKIDRASEILFNETSQKWDIHLPVTLVHDSTEWKTVPEAQGFDDYHDARVAEVAWLEYARLVGKDPFDPACIAELNVLRMCLTVKAARGTPPEVNAA